MSQLNVDNIQNRTGSNGGPNFPSGITVAVGQTAYIHGNLQVDGTETIVNTETLNVADKTVGIGSTTNASNTTADGAGIEVFASSSQTGNNKTITWQNSSSAWTFGGGGIVATDAVVGSAVTINSSGIKAGIITATNGLTVSGNIGLAGGIDATGVVTATSYRGDGSQLSGIEAAPTIQAVVNGTLAAEQSVIVNSDGKVSGVSAIAAALSGPLSGQDDQETSEAAPRMNVMIGYDESTGRIAAIFRDDSDGHAEIIVGTRSGESITWGTSAIVGDSAGTNVGHGCVDICCIGSDEFFAIYGNSSGSNCFVRHITTTSSNTFSKGDEVTISTNGISTPRVVYDSTNNGVLMCYANGTHVGSRWATWSGTTITVSSFSTFDGGVTISAQASWDSKRSMMIYAYCRGTSLDGDAYYIMVYKNPSSAATINGTLSALYAAASRDPSIQYDATNDIYYGFYLKSNTYQYYKHGTYNASNTSISWSSEYELMVPSHETGTALSTAIDATTSKIMWTLKVSGGLYYALLKKGATQTLVVAEDKAAWDGSGIGNAIAMVRSLGGLAFITAYSGTSGQQEYYRIKQFATTNATTANFIGYSKDAYTNGQTGTIKVVGNVSTKSGLTPGKRYYVQHDGSLSTIAADPSIEGGKALTATSLLITSS